MRNYSKELEVLMEMTLELLGTLGSDTEWTSEDSEKVKRLKDIMGLIEKGQKIVGKPKRKVDSKQDKEIIARFLERSKQDR